VRKKGVGGGKKQEEFVGTRGEGTGRGREEGEWWGGGGRMAGERGDAKVRRRAVWVGD